MANQLKYSNDGTGALSMALGALSLRLIVAVTRC